MFFPRPLIRWLIPALFALALAIALTLSWPGLVLADAGPKPSMFIDVTYQGKPLADGIFLSRLLSCQDPKYDYAQGSSRDKPLPGLDQLNLPGDGGCVWRDPGFPVWGGEGENGQARFTYMLPSTFRVAVYVSAMDRLFITPQATRSGMHDRFSVDLKEDGSASIQPASLPLWESDWRLEMMCIALPLTLIVELAIVFLWSRLAQGSWKRLLLIAAIANILTLPLVWIFAGALSYMAGGPWAIILLAIFELFAFVVEGILYWRPGMLRFGSAIALSAVANLASFGIGFVLH